MEKKETDKLSVPKEDLNKAAAPTKVDNENKTLRNLFIIVGVLVVFFIVWIVVSKESNKFEYNGVKFERVKEIAPYRTSLPILMKDPITGATSQVPYYFYLRKDPKISGEVVFNGTLNIKKNMVIASDAELNCGGDGIISVANLAKLYGVLGTKVIKDENAGCDPPGNFMYVNMSISNETRIDQYGPACYSIKIKNCEVLDATERFMVETFVKVNDLVADAIRAKSSLGNTNNSSNVTV
ncbi:MAG: hypothetical protein AABW51_00295 [Nanoarchaeota archaeon]